MLCGLCKEEAGGDFPASETILLPRHKGDAIEIHACKNCLVASGWFCEKHTAVHIGYEEDATHVCPDCIEEETDKTSHVFRARAWNRLEKDLSPKAFARIATWCEVVSMSMEENEAWALMYAVISAAHRHGKNHAEIIELIISKDDPGIILSRGS